MSKWKYHFRLIFQTRKAPTQTDTAKEVHPTHQDT